MNKPHRSCCIEKIFYTLTCNAENVTIKKNGGVYYGKNSNIEFKNKSRCKRKCRKHTCSLRIPMATAIDIYLKQISLVGGIPFSVVLPKVANPVNADMMSVSQIHQKLEKGYADIEKGNVQDAASAFAAFREKH